MADPVVLAGIAAALGLIIGLLGGGGGIIAVPLLVAAGQTFLTASSQSLVIVGAGAAAALVPHHRAGRVDWRVGLTFGALGSVGAVAGARLAQHIDPGILLGGLTLLLIGGAITMWRSALGEHQRAQAGTARNLEMAGGAVVPTIGHWPGHSSQRVVGNRVRIVTLASAVGLVTGLLGVGAGFVVVPALVSAMKIPIKKATATALVVIVMNSAVAAVVRHGSQGTLGITLILMLAGAAFAVFGALASRRMPGWILSAAFASLMFLVAIYTVIQAVGAGRLN